MRPLEPITLGGRWVRLEPLGYHHLDALCQAAGGPRDTFALTHVPPDRAAMVAYIEAALAAHAAGLALPFATLRLGASDAAELVGSTRFGNIEWWAWPDGRTADSPDALEIGWTWLTPGAQRTGLNTEAKILMLDYAFGPLVVRRVTLRTDARNVRSRAAIERLGARLDGVLRAHMPAADGGIRDSAVYSMLASEWPAHRARLMQRLAAA